LTELGREVLSKTGIDPEDIIERSLDEFIQEEKTSNRVNVSPGKRIQGPNANRIIGEIAKAKFEYYNERRLFKLRQISQQVGL